MSGNIPRKPTGDLDVRVGDDHWLSGVDRVPTPHQTGHHDSLDSIVIHYTAGSSAPSSVRELTDPERKASVHLVVGRYETVTQIVAFDCVAWHAGKSAHHGLAGLNKHSIGIEIDNAGKLEKSGAAYLAWIGRRYEEDEVFAGVHRNQAQLAHWHRYTEEQLEIVYEVCSALIARYPTIEFILGHEEISPMKFGQFYLLEVPPGHDHTQAYHEAFEQFRLMDETG